MSRGRIRGSFPSRRVCGVRGLEGTDILGRKHLSALIVFDVLRLDGEETMRLPYSERRQLLDSLSLDGVAFVPPSFDDGEALFAGVKGQGLEGIVAKRRDGPYRPGERDWIKIKNRSYWRFGEEADGRG